MSDFSRRSDALAFLSTARQAEPDSAIAVVYLTALQDVAPEWVEAACRELAAEPRQDYKPAMPDVGTIRERAERLARDEQERQRRSRMLPAPKRTDDEPTFFCLDCLDETNGWQPVWCPGEGAQRVQADAKPERSARLPIGRCGRRAHGPHDYVVRCHCWGTNPIAEARRQRESLRQEKPKNAA